MCNIRIKTLREIIGKRLEEDGGERARRSSFVAAGHSFTANPTQVVHAELGQGRGILGVVDGFSSKGIEEESDMQWRKEFLRQIG